MGRVRTGMSRCGLIDTVRMPWHNAFCALVRILPQRLGVGWVLICVAALLVGCTSTQPTVKIGLLAPFEGVHRPLGYDVLAGVKLAVQERNAAGGVGGFGIELVALNDDGQAAQADRQAAALAADPAVVGVVGPWQTHTARTAAPAYARAGLPAVVPAALPDDVLRASPGVYRLYAGDETLAATLASVMPHDTDWTLVGDAGGWPDALSRQRPRTENGGALLVFAGDGEAVARALLEGQCQAPATTCLAGPAAHEPVVPARTGAAIDDVTWVSSLPTVECTAEWADFCARYTALAGRAPGPHAVLAYEATHVLLDAMAQAASGGTPQRARVATALAGVERQAWGPVITFDTTRSWEKAPTFLHHGTQDSGPR